MAGSVIAAQGGSYEALVVDGDSVGEMAWLRNGGSDGRTLAAGLWRSGPAEFDYVFPGDESFCVLRGSARIETEAGVVEVAAGDVATYDAGTTSRWTIETDFEKFTVVA